MSFNVLPGTVGTPPVGVGVGVSASKVGMSDCSPVTQFALVNCQLGGTASATLYVPPPTVIVLVPPLARGNRWGMLAAPPGCGLGPPFTVKSKEVFVESGDGLVTFLTMS